MKFKEYVELAMRTNADVGDNHYHYQIGLYNEFGEMMGVFKKAIFKPLDRDKLNDELGDCFWYLAKGFTTSGQQLHGNVGHPNSHNTAVGWIKAFNKHWENGNLLGIYDVLVSIAYVFDLNLEECWMTNVNKLKARHPNKFSIDNEKHSEREREAITHTWVAAEDRIPVDSSSNKS